MNLIPEKPSLVVPTPIITADSTANKSGSTIVTRPGQTIRGIQHCGRNKDGDFVTPLGVMTLAEYSNYVGSLIPKPIHRFYQKLSCGHRYTVQLRPGNNCRTCWAKHFHDHPALVASLVKMNIPAADLKAHYGANYARHAAFAIHDARTITGAEVAA